MMIKTGTQPQPPPDWATRLADLEQVRKILSGEVVKEEDLLPTAHLLSSAFRNKLVQEAPEDP